MPLYTYRCLLCGHERDEFRSVAERDRLPLCDQNCDGDEPDDAVSMERVVTAPYVAADMTPYQSMIDGSWITSRSRHNEHLKAHGCIEIGNEMHHLKAKEKPELSKESRAARKQTLIEQVNALK
jgi:putative FmdB family regulatory protein